MVVLDHLEGAVVRRISLFVVALIILVGMVVPAPASAEAKLVRYPAFGSSLVPARDVVVWLPDGYEDGTERLPVVYMQDGENLFDARRSLSGASWNVAETVLSLIRERKIPPVIIVGIASTDARGREYLPRKIVDLLPEPTRQLIAQGWHGPPESDRYLQFLVNELKPFIDAHYRTESGRETTFVMGSSMGGLIAFYAQMEYPEIFGGSASLSMHWLLGDPAQPLPPPSLYPDQVLRAFETLVSLRNLSPKRHRIYVDRGTEALDARYAPFAPEFERFMADAGWAPGKNFESLKFPGAGHSEKAWADRLATPMTFLLGPLVGRHADEDAARLAQVRHAASPADYLISKFDTADLVLLGEDHAVKQNLDFVAGLIPKLYAAGVTNLVMEFGAEEDQAALDALVTAPTYDAETAKRLMFHYNVMWSWKEYRALYRAAWGFNRTLPVGSPRFRIVNMSYVYRWNTFTGLRTPATLRRVFWRDMVDAFRANLIEREVLERHQKALVLTGTLHAFTRFAMPETHSDSDGFCLTTSNALGNRLFAAHGARVTNVLLHQSLPSLPGATNPFEQPGGGEVERVMHLNGDRPVGFDLVGTPMGTIPDRSIYALCDRDFTLSHLFDGYVFLAPFDALRAATIDPDFVNETNIDEAIRDYPDPDWSDRPATLAEARAHLRDMATRIDERYAGLARHF